VPDLTYRAATADDVPAIGLLVQSAYRGESSRKGWTTEADLLDGIRITDDQLRTLIEADGSTMLVAENGTGLVGCCHVQRRNGTGAYFGTFAIRPDAQTGGLGRALLTHAEEYARQEWHAADMEMTVIGQRSELIAWYERRGYVRTGEKRDFPYGDDTAGKPRRDDLYFIVLRKSLAE
jgi:ribosomal protein S18 acetylase RimI-like enzyme